MIEHSAEDERALYRIARSLLQEHDYGDLLTHVLDLTIQALRADRGCIVVRENDGYRATVARNFRNEALSERERDISTTIANTTVREGKVLNVGDALTADDLKSRKSVRRLQLRSVLCAPLIVRDEAFALVYLENRQVSNHFQESDQQLLSEICGLVTPRLHIAIATESARRKLRELAAAYGDNDGILTAHPAMLQVLEMLAKIAPTTLPVLIQGETGTGKELVARALHRRSARANGPMVVVDCGAIPLTLIESELFGSVRGAYSGASDRVGLIGSANRGTLFLDEIGELPLEAQTRFLRVLQTGEFHRVGSSRVERADLRIIAATKRDLEAEVEQGRFRDDLYFRLSSFVLRMPPLRERKSDLVLLANHLLRAYAGRYGQAPPRLSSEGVRALLDHSFPGNVRELEFAMASLVAVCPPGEEIPFSVLSDRLSRRKPAGAKSDEIPVMSLSEMEKKLIVTVLRQTADNRTHAAKILGISREGLRTKMQKFGLVPSSDTEADQE